MKKITRKKHLEMKLQSIPAHPKPKVGLEQYTTPAIIASDLLWNASSLGDIEAKDIVDLGCGTGIFAIGSALMGANSSLGVDIDADSISLACNVQDKLKIDNVSFICSDINDFNDSVNVDTVFQNPPFGSQRNADKGQDLKFVEKAVELSPEVLYSFHMASTEEFLISYFEKNKVYINMYIYTHTYTYTYVYMYRHMHM